MATGLNIIYEDSDILVIDKPAGLVVHPSPTHKKGTLVDDLLAYCPQLRNVGESPWRPGIVHRLDKDTSGVLLIAKNNQIFQYIKKQFQNRKMLKKYLALVVGKPLQDKGIMKTYLSRDKKDKTRQKVSLLPLAKGKIRQAVTKYKIIKKFKDYSLLEIQPKTGRLHQIRAHLRWLGHPVAGDKKYSKKGQPCPSGLKRQFLHAISLALQLPNGQLSKFQSPLPEELKKVLKDLQKR